MACLLVASLAAAPSLASAQLRPRELAHGWIVEPLEASSEVVTVDHDGLLMKQRLFPTGLAELASDITIRNRLYPAGSQLFQVISDVPVYCVIQRQTPKLEKLFGTTREQHCLVDADGDQKFEGFFPVLSYVKALPMVEGKRPTKAKPIEPVAYKTISPLAIEKPFWIGIAYFGNPLASNDRTFQIQFGSDTEQGALTSTIRVSGASFPVSETVLGSSFTVLGVEDGKLRLRVDQTMPAQVFGVHHSYGIR